MTHGAATLHGVLADRSAWETTNCPVSAALGVVGTRSAMLLIREAYYGTTRFDDFAARVGITEAVAAARLRELTDAGVLRRQPYKEPGSRTRHEYVLTDMGRDLAPAVLGLFAWGSKYLVEGGARLRIGHEGCGAPVEVAIRCADGHDVSLPEIALSVAGKSTPSG